MLCQLTSRGQFREILGSERCRRSVNSRHQVRLGILWGVKASVFEGEEVLMLRQLSSRGPFWETL